MRIEQTVEVEAPLDRVWALVNDVPRVAPCMPGAELTEVVDERTFAGTVKVKLGPINLSYKGTVVLEEVDEAAHRARLQASGRDVRGGGTAKATVDTRLEAVSGDRTRMSVETDLHLTGRVASFGRGAVQDVSAKLFGQFADCLRDTLEAAPAAATAEPASDGVGAPAAAGGAGAAPSADRPAPAAASGPAEPASRPAAPAPAARATQPAAGRPLKVGGLVGTVIVGRLRALVAAIGRFFRRWFGGR
jgi:carbon monoxide dehydrogenase subunit G